MKRRVLRAVWLAVLMWVPLIAGAGDALEARELGLVSEVVPAEQLEAALPLTEADR